MTLEAQAEPEIADPSPVVALSFLAPWALVSIFLPAPWRELSCALVGVLAVLLLASAAWAFQHARSRGLDGAHWAFVTVLTLGVAMLVLAFGRPEADEPNTFVCMECGHRAQAAERFCYGCGAA